MNSIKPALDAHKPVLVATYTRQLTNRINYMLDQFKMGNFRLGFSPAWKNLRGLCDYVPSAQGAWNNRGSYTLNTDKVTKEATECALATIETWHTKIQAKMGQLESATVHQLDGLSFHITGTKAGHRVSIKQTMMINVSPKGKPFNQFPARIYVDGKFTPEAQFKKLQ